MRREHLTVKAKYPQVKTPLRPLHRVGTLAALQVSHSRRSTVRETRALNPPHWGWQTGRIPLSPKAREGLRPPHSKTLPIFLAVIHSPAFKVETTVSFNSHFSTRAFLIMIWAKVLKLWPPDLPAGLQGQTICTTLLSKVTKQTRIYSVTFQGQGSFSEAK